ncbi:hypothetical protein Psal006b_00618 [Piscirickettsia salmonis]|uniref:Membrane protein n=1 Tax=Piscirickettsia salmonis TaxID=1238 RepID=A0A1L6TE73_PISSA|nr:hypothetical protein [Piscirickettsia salmonis]ALB23750.1 membrane protein [Piscirickettsia salmonis]ALT18656.1 hypothetical protein PSLF89_07420 [Piscirickettsia salmonis LF-89 = ATCC VR-1361]ALY03597.1 hypothetical protein AWE47_12690 [Piscirickettsia salmonis]AMA43162.1 hypothetical protein AWJ11_12920 [Piscirickettsia salmonis]AOS35633.1 hypothetical protein AVM72_10045 [Piscirickettsia salmonis]
MSSLSKVLAITLLSFFCTTLLAVDGRTMTIKNKTGAKVMLYFDSFDCMYPSHGNSDDRYSMDGLKNYILDAGSSVKVYEEMDNSGSCYVGYHYYKFHAMFYAAPYIQASIKGKIHMNFGSVSSRTYYSPASTLSQYFNISEGESTFYINAPSDSANPDDS